MVKFFFQKCIGKLSNKCLQKSVFLNFTFFNVKNGDFNVKNGDFNVKIAILSPFFRHFGEKKCKNLEKPIFANARLTICEYIFEKKMLPKVSKLIVAPDYVKSKQNRTVSTCKKLKVVNLRFFFVIFFHFFFNFWNFFKKS